MEQGDIITSTIDKPVEYYLGKLDYVIYREGNFDKVKASNPSYKTYMIGDSKEPRTFMEAIHEGFQTAYNLDR